MSSKIQDRQVLEAGRIFIREGDDGDCAYLVQKGSVRVFTENIEGKKIELAELGPGSIIGEVALILDEPRAASVETIEPSVVITISRKEFAEKMRKADKTLRGILKLLSQRLVSQNVDTIRKRELEDIVDVHAATITESFSKSFPQEKRGVFMEEVMPHMNGLIKALKAFKEEH